MEDIEKMWLISEMYNIEEYTFKWWVNYLLVIHG